MYTLIKKTTLEEVHTKGNCIYWRPQHWRLVVNPECINYIYWRPYLVWFIFVRLRSGDWFGAQNKSADRNWGFCLATYLVSEILTLSLIISFTGSNLYHILSYQAIQIFRFLSNLMIKNNRYLYDFHLRIIVPKLLVSDIGKLMQITDILPQTLKF